MYLHSNNYPDFSNVTYHDYDKISDPSLVSWSYESSHRNRSYIPEQHSNLLAAMRPNKQAPSSASQLFSAL
eukprot:COSAG01_NODE_2369_length_7814_cov_22.805185_10_plen_71_part_00